MEQMRVQAEHVGARIENEYVTALDLGRRPFRIQCDSGRVADRRRDHSGDRREGEMAGIAERSDLQGLWRLGLRAPATGSSSAARRCSSSAAAIPRSRRRSISPISPRKSRSCIAANSFRAEKILCERLAGAAECQGEMESRGRGNPRRRRPARRHRRAPARHPDRRARGDRRRTAFSSRSAMRRRTNWCAGSSR